MRATNFLGDDLIRVFCNRILASAKEKGLPADANRLPLSCYAFRY